MLTNVAVLITDGVAPFELGVLCEAFGIDRTADGVPLLDFAVCATKPGPVRTTHGFSVNVEHGLERLLEADLLCIPAVPPVLEIPDAVLDAIRTVAERGTRILSVCSGAFLLGAAGVLDGRRCTTHWMHAEHLQRLYPKAKVDPDVLYVDDDPVITAAGSAAGLDACLYLWRKEYGAHVAATIARRIVVPPHRDGGQAQYVRTPMPECRTDSLTPLLEWVQANLADELTVDALAERAHLSPRTFARRFRDETGTTPKAWLTEARVRLCEELLEQTDLSIEQIATRSGFGTAAVLRQHFGRARGVAPQAYRRTFGQAG